MYDKNTDHSFIICAFQESPYLEACIKSLKKQTVQSQIRIVTSTPNRYIDSIASMYEIPVICNHGEHGIAGDWNFALETADTPLVTIAHQDDIYGMRYTESILKAAKRCNHPLILFTNYCELRKDGVTETNRLLKVKRLMLAPLIYAGFWKNIWIRRRILSLGSAICCPSVTIVKDNVDLPVFENNMKSNIDWQAWEKLSNKRGEFAYISKPMMLHRIHEDSTTSILLADDRRREEDLFMYRKFWPDWMARLIEHYYSAAEKSNWL